MAPLGQYLIADRNTEIATARNAAPDAISCDANHPRRAILGARFVAAACNHPNLLVLPFNFALIRAAA